LTSALLDTMPMWFSNAEAFAGLPERLLSVVGEIGDAWHTSYRRYVTNLRASISENAPRSPQGFAASGAFTRAEVVIPSEGEALVEIKPS
jgi:hypothetical protein